MDERSISLFNILMKTHDLSIDHFYNFYNEKQLIYNCLYIPSEFNKMNDKPNKARSFSEEPQFS